ncbi:MAG: hypothetical protein UF228_07320 [Lachnospiraceae bacterium]|nr:hypothetical protein [Lachnospiraceae bacterium]
MSKKKIKMLIISLIIVITSIMFYVLLLSKPLITVKSVSVESMDLFMKPGHLEYIEGVDPVDSIEYFIERSRIYGDNDIQVFMKDDSLPSNSPSDYAKVTLEFEIKNMSVFDAYCEYIFVNGGKDLYESYFVTKPNVEVYVADSLSTTKECKYTFYIYTKGKSVKEIENFVRDLQLQFPFVNNILKNSNQYFNVDDNDDVIFFFDGIQ